MVKISTILDKAKVSGITGLVGAIAAIFSGYVNLVFVAALASFFITMMIQYGAIKFKIIASLTTITFIVIAFLSNFGGKQ